MPSIFVLGDSISIQYGPYLERLLAGRITYTRKDGVDAALANLDIPEGANGGDARMCLTYLRARCVETTFRPDLLVLNCGLHDIKRTPPYDHCQVPEDDYRIHLRAIHDLLRARGTPLCWVRTTPVVDAIHNARSKAFHRFTADQARYNAAADAVLADAEHHIDLEAATRSFGGDEIFCDHVHFTEPVRQAQAAFIAGHLLTWLGR